LSSACWFAKLAIGAKTAKNQEFGHRLDARIAREESK